jgi:hypothetical protein
MLSSGECVHWLSSLTAIIMLHFEITVAKYELGGSRAIRKLFSE